MAFVKRSPGRSKQRISPLGLAPNLPRRRDNAKLLQQAQLVCNRPAFHDLAAHEAVDVDSRQRNQLAGGGTPWNSPLCVARAVQRVTTVSPSAI